MSLKSSSWVVVHIRLVLLFMSHFSIISQTLSIVTYSVVSPFAFPKSKFFLLLYTFFSPSSTYAKLLPFLFLNFFKSVTSCPIQWQTEIWSSTKKKQRNGWKNFDNIHTLTLLIFLVLSQVKTPHWRCSFFTKLKAKPIL